MTTIAGTPSGPTFAPGALVTARGREWVVLPDSEPDLLVLRPLGGGDEDTAAVLPALEAVEPAVFPIPDPSQLGDAASAELLRTALRIGFRSSAGPFRSLANLAVEPRAYQYVPLLLALKLDPVRLLIADDVGIGKTIEAGLIAAELMAQGDVRRMAVLCSPALAEQWQQELREKFAIDAELVLPSTVTRLTRGLMLNQSLFDRYPHVVVSTDFIKSHTRRSEFLNHCPELVIVDEAHSAVADGAGGGTRARTQRHDLLKAVAADRTRHLILVTATPHSGKEEGFRNLLGLLDPELATVNLDETKGRERLAHHFVQRQRGDIRRYLDEETAFPRERLPRESDYTLTPGYAELFGQILDFVRGQVTAEDGSQVRQRVRWWSALALLRALSSSPRAAAATLRTRAQAAEAVSTDEADRLGRAVVLDTADDEGTEGVDITPGGDPEPDDAAMDDGEADASDTTDGPTTRRLRALARAADALSGPKADAKLALLIRELKTLLADGYDPIVFCRFIDTADYVAEHLTGALGRGVHVAAVTGTLPPDLRKHRIAELAALDGRHVLVATDCLSEGINLQDHFQAVVHYDLAWNPTRHEQREGRVDRFGQTRDVVRTVTIYGRDNQIDGIVLDVLIRKHKAIRAATGVSIPVPDGSDGVVEALMEGLMLRRPDTQQLTLDLGLQARRDDLHAQWDAATRRELDARERRSRTKFAHEGVHPEAVAEEVAAARAALGSHAEIETFVDHALRALGAGVTPTPVGFTATTATVPVGLRDALPPGHGEPLPFRRDLPVERGHAVLARTDPAVSAVARHVLDTALDQQAGNAIAARAGVARSRAVTTRTTILLTRFRFHVDLPNARGPRSTVAEDAAFVGFTGSADAPTWLDAEAVNRLVATLPDANVAADQAQDHIRRVLEGLPSVMTDLAAHADRLAVELDGAHRRVRTGARATVRGLTVTAQTPVDILGVYVWLPVPAAT